MYVIFPADEVVYLSYGRLIYVPHSPRNTQVNHQSRPTPTASVEEYPQSSSGLLVHSNTPTVQETRLVVPQIQQTTSLERKKLKNKPDNILTQPVFSRGGNKSRQSPEVSSTTKFHKRDSDSSKSISQPSTASIVDESENKETNIRPRSVSESKHIAHLNRPPIFGGSLKVQKSIKERNLKVLDKSKTLKPEDPNSGCVLCGDGKVTERNEIPRSEIINTRSDQLQSEKTDKVRIKRENSFIRRIFNGQFSNSRNVVNEKSTVDFDSLFKREKSTEKSVSAPSTPSRFAEPGRDSSVVQKNTKKLSEKSSTKLRILRKSGREGKLYDADIRMAANESPLKDLIHPDYNEHLKSHNAVTFKLVRIVSDFTQQLGQMYEHQAEELQNLVSSFRKRNSDLRKERPACPSSLFHTWETLLQDVEIDSQALSEIASILGRQVSRSLLEKSFYRKIQSRKIFTHRESYGTIIAKTEEKLLKCRQEYKAAYISCISNPSNENMGVYYKTHNAYVQQLHATNGMMEEYGKYTLPSLLQELEEVYSDLCSTVTEAIIQGAEIVSNRAQDRCQRYESLVTLCKSVSGTSDLAHFARSLPTPSGRGPIFRKIFVPPHPAPTTDDESQEIVKDTLPQLKDELVLDGLTSAQIKPSCDVLAKESQDLEAQIRQIQEALATLLRVQQRSLESNLYNKANEIQEDISMKRFDLKVSQIHLRAIMSQKELFSNKLDGETGGRDRRVSLASQGSMKTKWLKAFKNLKTPPEIEKKNGSTATKDLLKGDPDAHNFQENTYKKITPCDVCSQVLRGHTRQGLKCRICKMNVHFDCQEKAPKCQAKARLLRRQKSTSEIETRNLVTPVEDERITEVFSMPTINRRLSTRNENKSPTIIYNNGPVLESGEVDKIYQVLKQATEISSIKPRIEIVESSPGVTIGMNEGKPDIAYKSLSSRAIGATESMLAASSTPFAPNSVNSVEHKSGPPVNNVTDSTSMRRRIFAGMRNLTSFRSRSRHGSPGQRSISLPEKRNSQDASGTRPFGQPLYIGPQVKNGNGIEMPGSSPHSSKAKISSRASPTPRKNTKPRNKN